MLDVRPGPEYAAAHMPGAVHIPLDELADRFNERPADREVIAYCGAPIAPSPTTPSDY